MKDFFKYVLASITGYVIISIVISVFGIIMLIGIAMSGDKQVPVKQGSVLKLTLAGEIIDRKVDDPFESLPIFDNNRYSVQGLNQFVSVLAKAKDDPNISGVLLEFGALNTGFATCGEIRDALKRFSESGKFIYSYAAVYNQNAYYIATVSDSIFVNPGGGVDLRGFAVEQVFFKNTLEKLGVEVNVIKHGKYKSAVEPFTNTQSSPENEEQMKAMLDGLWNHFSATVCEARGIDPDRLNEMADSVMLFRDVKRNLANGIVDALTYTDEVEANINRRLGKDVDAEVRFVELHKYQNAKSGDKSEKPNPDGKIAIVYAEGGIDMGADGIKSEQMVETLRKIHKDSKIKAVVLRVNSPGGGGYGSEQIWHEVVRLQKKLPVVVSMGDYAASGGYYIACAADTILASPTTLTGSIGAFGVLMKLEKSLNKLGMTFDRMKTHEYSDILSSTKSMLPAEKLLLQNWLDHSYDDFVSRCAEGRQTTYEAIDAVGQGRVWIGSDARENNLVDKMGGLYDAVELAADMANLEHYSTVALPKYKSFLEKWMDDMQMSVSNLFIKKSLGDDYALYLKLKDYRDIQGIQMRIPFDLEIQ